LRLERFTISAWGYGGVDGWVEVHRSLGMADPRLTPLVTALIMNLENWRRRAAWWNGLGGAQVHRAHPNFTEAGLGAARTLLLWHRN